MPVHTTNNLRPIAKTQRTSASLLLAALFAVFASNTVAQSPTQDAEVKRLQEMLRSHYGSQANSSAVEQAEPTAPQATLEQDDEVGDDGKELEENASAEPISRPTSYSADAVLLSSSEAVTALAHITRRMNDPRIPDSHRDVAPICAIKTRLFETLVDSKQKSLKPLGKHYYLADVKLQPGQTTLAIKSQKWQVDLPEGTETQRYLVTFYRPPGGKATLHVISLADLAALPPTQRPDWLPPRIKDQLDA